MKVKTKVQAGGIHFNHNVTVKRANRVCSMKIKTKIRAGALGDNHNLTVKRASHGVGANQGVDNRR